MIYDPTLVAIDQTINSMIWINGERGSSDETLSSRAHGLARCDEGERAFPAAASCRRYFPDSQLDG